MKNRKWRCPALFLVSLIAGVDVTAAQGQNKVQPGEFVIENPTLINLGFEWFIRGDDNRNAKVEVSYRKQGETAWKQGLPLLRLQGERIYQNQGVFDVMSPNMFAGSILDLEPDTPYEARFVLSDPDGVRDQSKGTFTKTVTVRTRAEPKPYCRWPSLSRLSQGLPGNKDRARIRRPDVCLQLLLWRWRYRDSRQTPRQAGRHHSGPWRIYKYHPEYYTGDIAINATTPFEGTYYLTASGTPGEADRH